MSEFLLSEMAFQNRLTKAITGIEPDYPKEWKEFYYALDKWYQERLDNKEGKK